MLRSLLETIQQEKVCYNLTLRPVAPNIVLGLLRMSNRPTALRRKTRSLSLCSSSVTACLFILFGVLGFITPVTGLEGAGTALRRTQNTLEAFTGASYRVTLSPFHLVLARTPEQLNNAEMDNLFGVISGVIETYIRNQLEETSTALQYIFLRDMVDKFRNEQTTLSFPLGGIAQFSGSEIITSKRLDEWTQQALEVVLPGVLQSGGAASPSLSEVEFSVYLIDRLSDGVPSIEDIPLSPAQSKEDNKYIWVIIISVAATLAIVAAIALLVSRYYGPRTHRDYNGSKESTSVQTLPRSPASDAPPLVQTSSGDDRSEGSFTVNTEAGDSTALKSIHHNLASANHTETMEPLQQESTRINVRKDMLASTWIGDKDVPLTNLPPQVDSVLAPSHFAASKEEQARRMRMHQQIQAEAWDDESEVNESAIRFESAHELDGDEEEGKSAFLDSAASF